ncbi:hypothetical protein CEXT_362871 [Caerostris extrusa]|uniref:Uncharacterized protein n=1 Tax=Caerostris extrusa TaxID=172846 RepID=A0AAV4MWT5_CAEEX|nr:hypothetical protein CEXT_362871 [Caerostris extrusa]
MPQHTHSQALYPSPDSDERPASNWGKRSKTESIYGAPNLSLWADRAPPNFLAAPSLNFEQRIQSISNLARASELRNLPQSDAALRHFESSRVDL